jgi:hypothetical protein
MSSSVAWWVCPTDPKHQWSASPRDRFKKGLDCSFCRPIKYVVKKPSPQASLAKKYPEIARDWHPIKNGSLKPRNIAAASNVLVYWRCSNGHAERESPHGRVIAGGQCRRCAMLRTYESLRRQDLDHDNAHSYQRFTR